MKTGLTRNGSLRQALFGQVMHLRHLLVSLGLTLLPALLRRVVGIITRWSGP